jgi:hypothetical protein
VTGAYLLTPSVSLQGSYTNSIMRFGTAFSTPNAAQPNTASFFNTNFQSYNIGPQLQITPVDSLSINYQGSRAHFSRAGSFSSNFETNGGTVGWKRTFTPTLSGDASAGLTRIGTGANATLTYLANASLEWKHEHGGAMLKYSRSVFPSFFVVAVPLLSNVITASGTYLITGQLSATGSANYARNESTSGQTQLSFDSYSATAMLNYSITRTITAIASFTHSQFSQSFAGSDLTFNRNVVSLSLRGEWN